MINEVKTARSRFDGVLQGIMSPQGLDSGEETDESEASFDKKPPRKKQRREDGYEAGPYHHTYVMKLFDRSVDLAQFGESTLLYPIARAWMQNRPHDHSMRTAATLDVEIEKERAGAEEEPDSEAKIDRLPPPHKSDASEGAPSFRIPTPLDWPKEEFRVSSDSATDSTTLLLNHLSRWKTVRAQWKRQCFVNESRYSESMAILKKMFEESQPGPL